MYSEVQHVPFEQAFFLTKDKIKYIPIKTGNGACLVFWQHCQQAIITKYHLQSSVLTQKVNPQLTLTDSTRYALYYNAGAHVVIVVGLNIDYCNSNHTAKGYRICFTVSQMSTNKVCFSLNKMIFIRTLPFKFRSNILTLVRWNTEMSKINALNLIQLIVNLAGYADRLFVV